MALYSRCQKFSSGVRPDHFKFKVTPPAVVDTKTSWAQRGERSSADGARVCWLRGLVLGTSSDSELCLGYSSAWEWESTNSAQLLLYWYSGRLSADILPNARWLRLDRVIRFYPSWLSLKARRRGGGGESLNFLIRTKQYCTSTRYWKYTSTGMDDQERTNKASE